jgi:hypothetical protein
MNRQDEPLKPWSLLAYTVADDRGGGDPLDAPVKVELKEICDAADFGAVSIAVQVDFKYTPGVYRASIVSKPGSRGFEDITPSTHPLWKHIASQLRQSDVHVQKDVIDLNAASAPVLGEFFQFGAAECPAERYIVFTYGHACGPMGLFYDRESAQHVPNTLRLNDVAKAIAALNGAAVVLFRDCYMNTLETAYELSGAAEYVIASQSEMPIAGTWPWVGMMSALMPGAPSASVARAMAIQLGKFMDDRNHRAPFADVPISLVDTAASKEVVGPLSSLVNALEQARVDPVRRRACAAAIDAARIGRPNTPSRPGDPALLDVPTLCEGLARVGWDAVAGPAKALASVVSERVVRWHHAQLDHFRGISLYCKPTDPALVELSILQSGDEDEAGRDAESYRTLALCRDTGWDRIALNPLVAAE